MEKQRLKDYNKVIENNAKIIRMYEQLSILDLDNKKNSELYINLKSLISKYESYNMKLLSKYDLYDQGLINYVNFLLVDIKDTLPNKMDVDILKNLRFLEQLDYLRNTTQTYDKRELYDGVLVYVEEFDCHFERNAAIEVYSDEEECSLEEAEKYIDELYEEFYDLFFINEDDNLLKREIELDEEKAFNYYRNTYTNAVNINYLIKNIEKEDNIDVKKYVNTYIYTLIALSPSVEQIFLNSDNFDLNNLAAKKGLINLYQIIRFRNTFFNGWDENYMNMIEDSADTLTALECRKRLTNRDKALNIILKSKIQSCSSLIFDKDNLDEVNERKQLMYEFLHRKSSKKLLRESNELKKKLSLTQNI